MKLNHLNLPVTNVGEATTFFETYFKFTCISQKGNNVINVLKSNDGFTLVLMQATTGGAKNASYPVNFHIGFLLASAEQVNETYLHLKAGGVALEREPKNIRDSFGFYFNFDNILIEIATL